MFCARLVGFNFGYIPTTHPQREAGGVLYNPSVGHVVFTNVTTASRPDQSPDLRPGCAGAGDVWRRELGTADLSMGGGVGGAVVELWIVLGLWSKHSFRKNYPCWFETPL